MRTRTFFVKVFDRVDNKHLSTTNFDHIQFVNTFIKNLDKTLYSYEVV